MSGLETVPGVQGGAGGGSSLATPMLLATRQPASVVAQLMLNADVIAQAQQAIPPTPAALLDISPAAAGLINPVVSLTDNTQVLLLGEQTLELIGTSPTHPPTAGYPTSASTATVADAAASAPGGAFDASA